MSMFGHLRMTDKFKVIGIGLGIVATIVLLAWGASRVSDAISMDPANHRQKRIEKKIDEMGLKFDHLIDLGKKWE